MITNEERVQDLQEAVELALPTISAAIELLKPLAPAQAAALEAARRLLVRRLNAFLTDTQPIG